MTGGTSVLTTDLRISVVSTDGLLSRDGPAVGNERSEDRGGSAERGDQYGWPAVPTGLERAAAIAARDHDRLARFAIILGQLGCPCQQARTAEFAAGLR